MPSFFAHPHLAFKHTHSERILKLSLLSLMIACAHSTFANEHFDSAEKSRTTSVLPTIAIEAMSAQDPVKTYVDYKQASVTRNGLDKKDIPQTIDTIDVQKYKIYGSNDLSVMLQGTPGVDTAYDMRGDGIKLRGFQADVSDIYRDGVRESGQVRRSTANIERIEILKGPASVLYGRSAGGGVINMVSKYANFDSKSSVGIYTGSFNHLGTTLDVNQVISDQWAARLTTDVYKTDSFRQGISSDELMLSPSVTFNNQKGLVWTGQYTYDRLHRVPDRGPNFFELPSGTSRDMGFAQDGDYVNDTSQTLRSDLSYTFAPDWTLHWAASYRQADQDFDHFYAGKMCTADQPATATNKGCYKGYIDQNYYWQQTSNKTTSTTFDVKGKFNTGAFQHQVLLGIDASYEQREPKLANKNSDGTLVYGFVNPLTGDRFSHRADNPLITQHNYNQGTSYGVFAQDLITIVPEVKLMLGLRYDYYKNSTSNKLKSETDQDYKRTVSDQSVSPNIGVVWQPVESQSIYASYSKSFAPFGGQMGISVISASQNLNTFDAEPQYSDQYEIGLKSDWMDERLTTQFSVYDIRKHNIRYRPDEDKEPDVWAVGGEHQSRGAEFSFIGRVLDNVYVRGGYSFLDATVKQNKEKPELVGNRLKETAKQTGNLFVRYLPTEQWYAEIGVTKVGDSWNDVENTQKLKGFNRADAAIGYSANPWNVTLALTNLTDKEYWRSSSMPGTPRSALLRVNYEF